MSLAIRIQHKAGHREWYTDKLIEMLDNDKRIEVFTDKNNDLWGNCRKMLTSYKNSDTHMLVLQDDIVPCFNFLKTAEHLATVLPDEIIALFSNSEKIPCACKENKTWVRLTTWFMAQAYVMPVKLIEPMLTWLDEYVKPSVAPDDLRFAIYCFYNKRKVWATAPCLVEHIGYNATTIRDVPFNYLDNRNIRMAGAFVGIDIDPLDRFNWKGGVAKPLDDVDGNNGMFCDLLLKQPTI